MSVNAKEMQKVTVNSENAIMEMENSKFSKIISCVDECIEKAAKDGRTYVQVYLTNTHRQACGVV